MQKISITNESLLAVGPKKDVTCLGRTVKYFSRYGNWEDIKKRRASLVVPPIPRPRLSAVSTGTSDSSNSAKTGIGRRNGQLGDLEFLEEGEYLNIMQQSGKRDRKGVKDKRKQVSKKFPKISNSRQQQHNKSKETRDTLDEKLKDSRTLETKDDDTDDNRENDDQIWKYGIDWRRDPEFGLELTRPYTFSYLPALPYYRKHTSENRKNKRTGKMRHASRQQAPPVHKF